jgi:hypothetical protein
LHSGWKLQFGSLCIGKNYGKENKNKKRRHRSFANFFVPRAGCVDGVWRATVKLEPGTHHYRFLVDGEWRDDPECTLRAPNPFGGENMTRQVA